MIDVREVSTQALAYLGDCVLEMQVRSHLVNEGLSTSGHLNEAALSFVRASAQAEAMKRILPLLSEEEEGYFRRGRNLGHSSVPKHATVSDYRMATGMESLFGFLHLAGRYERIAELFTLAYLQVNAE
ncbi:MAG: ribonuclease III [Ruminococcaceae bacterium]|nr:ribonuclease III [Oscillospiraceae bacterium]